MIYEKPRIIDLSSSTARGGDDCIGVGPVAIDKCQAGVNAVAGDCIAGGIPGTKCATGAGGPP